MLPWHQILRYIARCFLNLFKRRSGPLGTKRCQSEDNEGVSKISEIARKISEDDLKSYEDFQSDLKSYRK